MKIIELNVVQAVFGWPLYSAWNAWIFASSHHGWAAKVLTFLTFLPVLILTTALWTLLWAIVGWLLMSAISE